ncbi:hypothetical protein [Myxococcus faecalis]|uniref:hypothetical protein n=1 Tax=Myxococcus faecalis TaxID=3115646 RepID=UPI003CF06004
MSVHDINARGPYRFTRAGRDVYHMPLARPWSWALTHHGMWSLFVTDQEPAHQGVPDRRFPLHPPESILGHWLAIYATAEYDGDAVQWLRKAHSLEAPAGDVLPAGSYVAMARLAEVSTIGNDSRSFGRDPWWSPAGSPYCRGTIAWWLEEMVVFEPLRAAQAGRLTYVDQELLPELRERVRLARDGIWRPDVYPVPLALPLLAPEPAPPPPPPAPPQHQVRQPPRRELPANDSPVPPMGLVQQLGLFGAPETPADTTRSSTEPTAPADAPLVEVLDVTTPCGTPPSLLMAAAARVRELLADGAPHDFRAVMAAAGNDLKGRPLHYRVTACPVERGPLAPWKVLVTVTGDGQGRCWHTARGMSAENNGGMS